MCDMLHTVFHFVPPSYSLMWRMVDGWVIPLLRMASGEHNCTTKHATDSIVGYQLWIQCTMFLFFKFKTFSENFNSFYISTQETSASRVSQRSDPVLPDDLCFYILHIIYSPREWCAEKWTYHSAALEWTGSCTSIQAHLHIWNPYAYWRQVHSHRPSWLAPRCLLYPSRHL